MRRRLFLPFCFFLLWPVGAMGQAQVERPDAARVATRFFGEVAISPGGTFFAWVENRFGPPSAERKPGIYVSKNFNEFRITAAESTRTPHEHGLAWSPHDEQLAFLSDAEKPGQLQLYVTPKGVYGLPKTMRKLTNLTGLLAHPHWSPDGKQIAFLYTQNAKRAAGPTQAGLRQVGVIEDEKQEQRLAVVDVDSGQAHEVSPAGMYVYEYDWRPDSKAFALIAAPVPGDNNWYIAQLYTLGIDSGKPQSIYKPPLQIAVPRWSPDGKQIALVGGLMSDEGSTGGDIFVVPAEGGTARNVTPDLPASVAWFMWKSPTEIFIAEHLDGGCGFGRVLLDKNKVEQTWRGDVSLGVPSFTANGEMGEVVKQSFDEPPGVYFAANNRLSLRWTGDKAERAWGKAENLHWKSDEFTIQGWLVYPRDFDPTKRYPLVLSVHGGPAASRKPAWARPGFDLGAFSGAGYFVFYPNPRGSFGQGERFTQANVKDFGHGDLRDILRGVDEILRTHPAVDPARLGIMGGSYGGFMTMWAVTQTDRFKGAVAVAGVANWQSYYGQNGIERWMIPYFGKSVYDDPDVYAKSSPINFIKRVKTPTLVLVGERDRECPAPQSFEFWHALKTFGVPTELVVYADEGHGVSQPAHRRDAARRTIEWMNRYVRDATSSATQNKAVGQSQK